MYFYILYTCSAHYIFLRCLTSIIAIGARQVKVFLKLTSSIQQKVAILYRDSKNSNLKLIQFISEHLRIRFVFTSMLNCAWYTYSCILFFAVIPFSHILCLSHAKKKEKEKLNISFLEVVCSTVEYGNTLIYKPWCYMELF